MPSSSPLTTGRSATAEKHVANMLQRPDQLEKVNKYMLREVRKKTSVDGVLKTAMQTQLDGVRTGLANMQIASEEMQDINSDVKELKATLSVTPTLSKNLHVLKLESKEHVQWGAAFQNLEHILNIPNTVQEAIEFLTEGKLLPAHQSLAILENSRDDLLFELYKLPTQSPTDMNMLKRYFKDVEKLSEEISKQLWLVLGRTLNSVRKEPKVIVNALRIIEREESVDAAAIARQKSTDYIPIGRPKRWKQRAFEVFKKSVLERVEGNQFEGRSENKMWLVRHLEVTRQLITEDLRVVKNACVPCFPPKYEIFDEFVKIYHECLSKHLEDIVANELEDNEFITLLTWIMSYGSEEMLGHPDLNINVSNLGPLLEPSVVESLESQYLHNVRKKYKEWMKNTLATDVKDWHRQEGPDQNESGKFHTQLPLIMCNMLDQHLQVAQTVSKNVLHRMMLISLEEVLDFTHCYEESILSYRNKHFGNRSLITYFTYYMIATANNCLQFSELADELRQRYCKDLRVVSVTAENVFQKIMKSFFELLLQVLKLLKEELFMDLNNHLNDLLTRRWFASGNEIVETICATLEDYGNDYTHLYPENFALLIKDVMHKITITYVQAILQRKMTFKNYEERKQVAEKMCKEGKSFQELFDRAPFEREPISELFKTRPYFFSNYTLEDILRKSGMLYTSSGSPFEAINHVSEVLKLRDISMLSLEISGVIRHYSDISNDQLLALLLFRGDVSKSEARQFVADNSAPQTRKRPNERTIFADVSVTV